MSLSFITPKCFNFFLNPLAKLSVPKSTLSDYSTHSLELKNETKFLGIVLDSNITFHLISMIYAEN